jgi:hypothetical protein
MTDETPDLPPSAAHQPDAWELVCTGILRTEFGRRPSRAVNHAILRLAAEEAVAGRPVITANPASRWAKIHRWISDLPPRPALALGFALLLVAGVSICFLRFQLAGTSHAVSLAGCTLTDAAAMRWASGSAGLKVGDEIPPGWLQLEAGTVEITFASSAKVAVEGPAQFKLTGGLAMELQAGKISTEVPKKARGFTVKTPTATVVDLGTRFGAIVGGDKSSEVDVFQGHVNLLTTDGKLNRLSADMAMFVDASGATSARALPETAFPMPNLAVEVRPQNCGFDVSGRTTAGEVPVDFGYWSGLSYSLTGATAEVQPANGPGMLEFFNSATAHHGDSEVWQLMDLRPYKKLLAGGHVEGKLTALFNRVAGEANAAKKFSLTLAAFHGSPAGAKSLWAGRQALALALTEKELVSDDNPETWEPLEVEAKLPPETDFVMVQIRALAPPDSPNATLAGHFADLVDLRLCAPMRASSLAIK